MNENNKIIGLSTIMAILISLGFTVTPTLFNETQYFCESRPELNLVTCDSFAKYVADNGKCIRNDNTNLICRTGWLEVTDDTVLPEEKEQIPNLDNPEMIKCTKQGCEVI